MLGEERQIITKDLQQNIRPWMYFLYQPCEKLAIKRVCCTYADVCGAVKGVRVKEENSRAFGEIQKEK